VSLLLASVPFLTFCTRVNDNSAVVSSATMASVSRPLPSTRLSGATTHISITSTSLMTRMLSATAKGEDYQERYKILVLLVRGVLKIYLLKRRVEVHLFGMLFCNVQSACDPLSMIVYVKILFCRLYMLRRFVTLWRMPMCMCCANSPCQVLG
jgi:hypothetical protein